MEQLNRECSLFSEDGDFVIVGSASYIPEDTHPAMHELKQNNESVNPNPRNPLENYTLYCVEIAEGILTDKIEFRVDKIFLSHNQGVYLYKSVLAVLSVQHQTVHLYKMQNGMFIPERKIGRVLYSDDDLVLSHVLTAEQQTGYGFAYSESDHMSLCWTDVLFQFSVSPAQFAVPQLPREDDELAEA